MICRVEVFVFWLGIIFDIIFVCVQCIQCNWIVFFNFSVLFIFFIFLDYLFQCLCVDFFYYKGINYFVIVDRYFNWLIVEKLLDSVIGLINCFRCIFVIFGILDEFVIDGGLEFIVIIIW